jgi:hypothetical protein
VDLGIPELTDQQIEEVSQEAENAARKLVFSRVKQKQVGILNISVEVEGIKPLSFAVEVELSLLPEVTDVDERALADEAVKFAFEAIENCLKKLK